MGLVIKHTYCEATERRFVVCMGRNRRLYTPLRDSEELPRSFGWGGGGGGGGGGVSCASGFLFTR